jgi:hypothetical protein
MKQVYKSPMTLGVRALRISSVSTGGLCLTMIPPILYTGEHSILVNSVFATTVGILGISTIYLFDRMVKPFVSSVSIEPMNKAKIQFDTISIFGRTKSIVCNGKTELEPIRTPFFMLRYRERNLYIPVDTIQALVKMDRLAPSFRSELSKELNE